MLSPVQVPCLAHSCSQKESYFLPASSSGTCRVRVRTKIPVARFRIGQESQGLREQPGGKKAFRMYVCMFCCSIFHTPLAVSPL